MFRSATTPAATAAVVALALAPLLAACGSAASGSEPDAAGSSRAAGFGELEDTAWVTVTRADVAGAPITLKKGSRLSLSSSMVASAPTRAATRWGATPRSSTAASRSPADWR